MSRPASLSKTSRAHSNAGSLKKGSEMRTSQGDLSPDFLTPLENIVTEQVLGESPFHKAYGFKAV